MNEEWLEWGNKVERRLAKIEDFVRKGVVDFVCETATHFDDIAEMRVWNSIANRFDPDDAGKDLTARYELMRKSLKDGKRPEASDRTYFADRAVGAIKASMVMTYRGVWRATDEYHEGNFVTDGGSIWAAKVTSRGIKPGSNGCWQLAVKRGSDGKDLRS
jgi:hypothetical protein